MGVEADPAAAAIPGIGALSGSTPVGTPAITGVALGVLICAAESVLFRTVIDVPGPGSVSFINRLIAPNQAYVLVAGWVLAAAAGVLVATARSGVIGWSTRPGTLSPPAIDGGAAALAAVGLVIVAVPLSILAVSGGPGAISDWQAGVAGATAAAIGGGLALATRRFPLARTALIGYATSFWAEIVLARLVGRLSTSTWVQGSGPPAIRAAQALAFDSTWAVVAYAAAAALGASAAMLNARARRGTALAAALTPSTGVVLGLVVAGVATPATWHLSAHVASRLAAGVGAATMTTAAIAMTTPWRRNRQRHPGT